MKRLLPQNFKLFNRALNKTLLFLLNRKFASTSRNEELVKNLFPWEKLFSLPGISDKWKKRFFTSQKNSFYQEKWSFSVKIGFHIISIMVTTSKKNTIILKNTISPIQKRFYSFFLLVETIIETRKNPIFKK